MTILRAAARTMLASTFVVNGVSAIRQPENHLDHAEAITTRVLPIAHRVLPPAAASYLPTDTGTWVKVVGGARIAGGVMLATSLGRRCGALILASTMVPSVIASVPTRTERERSGEFMAALSLLGATLLAALDTQGKPSLAWRLQEKSATAADQLDAATVSQRRKAKTAAKKARRASRKAAHEAKVASRQARDSRS